MDNFKSIQEKDPRVMSLLQIAAYEDTLKYFPLLSYPFLRSSTKVDLNRSKLMILMIGPLPPPYGGIATFIENAVRYLNGSGKVQVDVYRTGKRNLRISNLLHGIFEIFLLLQFVFSKNTLRYDVYHIHTASYLSFIRNSLYVWVCKKLLKGRVVLHVHGGEFLKFYYNSSDLVKRIVQSTLEAADAVIVTSPSWIPKIKKIANLKKIYYLFNGFDKKAIPSMDSKECRRILGLPFTKKILLNVGGLIEAKGHKYLIDAMREVMNARTDVLCIIIGDGPLKKKLQQRVKELGLSNYIKFVGPKSHNEIFLWMKAADIFVLPSLNEGTPTVMFEALGVGLPFIGTSVGGVPDVIISDEYGLLVDPANPKNLSSIILYALDKKWDRTKIKKYADQFNWENLPRYVLELYKKVCY